MKKLMAIWALLLMTAFAAAQAEGVSTTVMVYMCGSNLETLNGSASEDIMEMLESGFDREQINLVLMTGGAKEWQGISADPSVTSIWDVSRRGGTLRQRWQGSLLNMGQPDTLTFFLQYAAENYPADRYALILWDHGGGPLSGICWDEVASDHLTLEELEGALAASPFADKGLEWIGFDACLMASAEVAWRMEPFARYMIASEETEPSYGWNYGFLNGLEQDADGAQTGTRIISHYIGSARAQDRVTLSCIDLARIDGLRDALDVYFSYMGQTLNEETFSERSNLRKASEDFGRSFTRAVTDTVSGDYDLVDVGSLLSLIQAESWMRLEALEALERCIVASGSSAGDSYGLSIYFPLYNKTAFQQGWRDAYTKLSFSDGYTQYVKKFGDILTQGSLVSWLDLPITSSPVYASDAVWLSTQLSPEQLKNVASVRLVAMGSEEFGVYYRTYVSEPLEIGEDGQVKALYDFTTLHAVDDLDGHSMTPPIGFDVTDEGYFAVRATASHSLSGDDADSAELILIYERDGQSASLTLRNVYVYDEQTASYSNRIGFAMEDYPYLSFPRTYRIEPWSTDQGLKGFDEWEISERMTQSFPISTRNAYHLEFVRDDLMTMIVWFEITDTQNNTYLSDGIYHGRESYGNMLSDDIAMGFTAQSLMIDEEGVYLSLSMANRFPRTFTDEKNRIYFFSPQINGIPCSFDEGPFTAWETVPESLNTGLLHIRWPEGVSVKNVESLRFRMLTRFTEYESGEANPPRTWCATEYSTYTWNPALLAGRSSASMNADCFEIQGSTAFGRMTGVPNYAEEIMDCPITREDAADIIITAPDAAPGEELVSAQIVYMDELNESCLCAIPVWKVDFARGTTEAQLPGGCLYTAIGGQEYPLYVECDAAQGTGTLMTDLSFTYGVEEQTSAFSLQGEVSLLYSCFNGTLLHDDLPVAMASRLELTLPFLIIPKDDLADGILEPRNYQYIDMPVEAELEQLPLTLSISQGYEDGLLVLFQYRRADGSEYILSPIPLEQASRQAEARLVPEEEWPQHWTSIVIPGERGERCLSFGGLVFFEDLSGTVWIKDYLGTEEELVIPETIGGKAVGGVSFDHENPYVRRLILPETIERVNMGSSRFPEYCPRCSFSQMPNLHTVEIPSWELDGEPLSFDWFFLEKSISNTYSYNSVEHVVCGNRDVYFSDGFYYEPQEDGSVTITGSIENGNPYITETRQVIPATLNGMPVKAIAEGAFARAIWPVDLVLEEGIEVIGAGAFANSRMQTLTLPATLKSIGESAFLTDSIGELRCADPGVPAITAYFGPAAHVTRPLPERRGIYHGEYVTADQRFRYALYDDGSACILGYVTQPSDDVLVIPSQVDGHPVVRVESGAFRKLEYGICSVVILEDGIEELAGNVFAQSYISELRLPSTLKFIEKDAFDCYGSFSEIRIPASVVQIDQGAFGDCLETQVIFTHVPEHMEINGTSDCISLLVCPEEIREELLSRFKGSTDALVVFAEEDERQHGDFTFFIENGEATILTASREAEQLEVPAQLDGCPVVRIAPYAFKNSNARRIALPDGLRFIGKGAFWSCDALTEVLLPGSLLSLGSDAFFGCDALTELVLPDSVQFLGDGALAYCKALTSVRLSASLTELPSSVLSMCEALEQVEIPEGVTTIGINAFSSCTSLHLVTLPDSLKTIDGGAFSRCWALKTIILPAGVTSISRSAFEGCADLKTIVLKGTLETIEDTAFAGDREMISYDTYLARMEARDAEAQEEPPREGLCGEDIFWSLDEDGTLRLTGIGAMTDFENRAAAPWQGRVEQIRALVIGEGIEHIGDYAFYHLLNLETVSFPSSLRSIGTSAFNGCDALHGLILPEGVTHIGFDAFGGCVALESIVLPDGIQEIKGDAFSCCTALQSIRLPEGLTTLTESVLFGCTSLREVLLPSSLRLIQGDALYGCTSLTSLVIPDGVTTIQPYAFRGCVNVTSIQIPASVTSIGADIFADVDYVSVIFGQFSNSPNYQYLKIIGEEGSAAQKYAEMYGVRFEPISSAD